VIYALFFNGLTDGTTRKREQLAINYLRKHGIIVEYVPINWRSDEPFTDMLARLTKLTGQKLKEHGKLLLIGSSAGGSLALNVCKQVNSKHLYAITLCSRLHDAKLAWWDRRTMQRMAYLASYPGLPWASRGYRHIKY
jgi:alpha-beta hydrolase superfamily lysophospholipase